MIALRLVVLSLGAALGVFYPFIPIILASRGFGPAQIGLIASIGAIGFTLAVPAWGHIADVLLGRARTLQVCAVGGAIAVGLLLGTWPPIVVALLLMAYWIFESSWQPLADALTVNLVDRRGYARVRLLTSLSFAVSSIAAGFLYDRTGFDAAFALTVLLAVAMAVAAGAVPDIDRAELDGVGTPGTAEDRRLRPSLGSSGVALRAAPRLVAILAAVLLINITIISGFTFLPLRLGDLGSPPSVVALSAGVSGLSEIPAMLVAARVASRIGLRGIFVSSALIYGAATAAWIVLESPELIIATRVITGIAFAWVLVGTVLTIARLLPAELQGTGQALYQTVAFGVGAIVANMVGGLLYQGFGHAAVFGLGTILAVAAAALGWVAFPYEGVRGRWRPSSPTRLDGTMPVVSHPWTSPELVSLGRLPMHAVRHHERLSLDGTWRFQLLETPTADLAADAWREIAVPGCWTRQDTWDVPQYTNVQMPFPGIPPDLPAVNPTGIYERTIDVPADWASRRIVLHVGAAESVLLVRVNDIDVGMSKDSHLAAEFDVTSVVQSGANEIRLTVVKWSDATYIEDQDQWWHGGITRSVFLYATDRTYLADIGSIAGLEPDLRTGTLQLTVDVASLGAAPEPGWSIEATIPGLLAPLRGSVPLQAAPDHPKDPGSTDLMRRHAVGGPPAVAERAAEWAELEGRLVPPLGGRVTFDLRLPDVEPWSSEIPRRYELVVDLLAPDGRLVERATLHVGFRRVEVSGVDLLINGRRVLIRGVNRHDFDQRTGRVVSEASMRYDVVAMKRFGFNAVRTSHYPNDPVFLDLCDELGLHVIDEADIESHAFQSTLCDDARYLAQWVSRVARMAIRDRNHPSIIAWSLGNESGHGANHDAAAAWLRRFDASRPLHYEGAIRWDWTSDQAISDLTCPMYPELEAIVEHARSGLQRHPLIMCEYSHAMGNSNGTLAEHWDAIEATPGLQGGFIWEWRDHGLLQSLPDGAVRWAYGGDFGDVPNDGNFCADGLTWPDGAPKPALWEHRALAAPLAIAWTGTALAITNRRDFTDLGDLRMAWEVAVDGEVAVSGRASVPAIAPGATEDVSLAGLPGPLPSGREVWLTTRWFLDRSSPWAPEGFEVCALQVPLTTSGSQPREVAVDADHPSGSSAHVLQVDDRGDLRHPHIAVSPKLCLWRAPTDNDRIGRIAATWSALGLDRLERRLVSLDRAADGRVTTVDEVTTGCGAVIRHERSVTDLGSGDVRIDEAVTVPDELVDVARVGVELEVVPGLETVDWFGGGPHESYPDRKRGALIGRWRSTVSEQTVPYIRPQENGGHADVRWLELADDTGQTLRLSFDRPMQVSATHHRATALAAATHHEELVSADTTIVHIDVAHRGLGTASCGPDTLPAYLVGPGTYRWSWTVRA